MTWQPLEPPRLDTKQRTTVDPLLWETSIQGIHKIWSRKSVHKVFVFVTSFEETSLFRGNGHFFGAPTPRFNLHSGDTLAIKKVTDHSLISS